MKILVTGSEGSLMQQVLPLLIAQGHTVKGVDNFARYGEIDRRRDYEFVRGDLTDPKIVDNLLRGVDGVIQAAALIYGVGGFHKYPADILSKDVALHSNILRAAVQRNVSKVCYISSSMVYERCRVHPSRERDAFESLIPATDYGMSKLMGEKLCGAFAAQYGLRTVVWRPFNIITPHELGEPEQGMSHVFADFIRNLVGERKNPLPIIGDGHQIRCFTWIGDIARAIAEFSFQSRTDGEAYNLGNPEPISMRDLAQLIYQGAQDLGLIEGSGELRFETVKEYSDDVVTRIPDVSKAKAELDWEPTQKIAQSVDVCLRQYRPEAATTFAGRV